MQAVKTAMVDILIGGPPSSGTSLFAAILDAHPQILCGPELDIFSHPITFSGSGEGWRERMAKFISGEIPYALGVTSPIDSRLRLAHLHWYREELGSVYGHLRQSEDGYQFARNLTARSRRHYRKEYWAEKSPSNIYSAVPFLDRAPSAKVVMVIRNGLDVVCSFMARGFTLDQSAANWALDATVIGNLARLYPADRLLTVRYEELVHSPATVAAAVCAFLGVDAAVEFMVDHTRHSNYTKERAAKMPSWRSALDQPISGASIGRWRSELTDDMVAYVLGFTVGDRIKELDARFVGGSFHQAMERFGYPHAAPPESAEVVPLSDSFGVKYKEFYSYFVAKPAP